MLLISEKPKIRTALPNSTYANTTAQCSKINNSCSNIFAEARLQPKKMTINDVQAAAYCLPRKDETVNMNQVCKVVWYYSTRE